MMRVSAASFTSSHQYTHLTHSLTQLVGLYENIHVNLYDFNTETTVSYFRFTLG